MEFIFSWILDYRLVSTDRMQDNLTKRTDFLQKFHPNYSSLEGI